MDSVWGDTPKLVFPYSLKKFEEKIKGFKFANFQRRGKFIIAHIVPGIASKKIKSEMVLVWHMRMTGHLLFRNEKKERTKERELFSDPKNQFIRMRIFFTDGTRLEYSDLRKFGTLRLFNKNELDKYKGLSCLGMDALSDKWTKENLRNTITKRKVALKQVLLDQTIISGIGNIYADEILWDAKFHPLTKSDMITVRETEKILVAMRGILKKAIKYRGSSVDDFRDLSGKKGGYGKFHRAYQRKNQPCFRCGEKMVRILVNGRGTCYCPVCQPIRVDLEPRRKVSFEK